MRLAKVEYDASEQKKRLKNILDGAYSALKGDSLMASAGEPFKTVDFLLYAFVTQWACCVKHKAFKEEQEWRITVFPSYAHSSPFYGEPPRLAHHPELRAHRGRLLPYVIVKPKAEKFDIESITVGPSNTQLLDAKAVELLRDQLGLDGVKVLLSDIPLQP
jgi:hypothetical protein